MPVLAFSFRTIIIIFLIGRRLALDLTPGDSGPFFIVIRLPVGISINVWIVNVAALWAA